MLVSQLSWLPKVMLKSQFSEISYFFFKFSPQTSRMNVVRLDQDEQTVSLISSSLVHEKVT